MSPIEQRIAIAEACGWFDIEKINTMTADDVWVGYSSKEAMAGHRQELPDYLNDLNAMRDAEICLLEKTQENPGLFAAYVDEIQKKYELTAICTSARERAEAFLKTIGKWKEADDLERSGV